MKELQNRQKLKRALYSIPTLIVLLIVAIFLLRGAVGIMKIERESAERVEELKREKDALALRHEELNRDILKLQTDEGVIEEIKEKFSVTREGEYVAIIVEEKEKATTTEDSSFWLKSFWQGLNNLWGN